MTVTSAPFFTRFEEFSAYLAGKGLFCMTPGLEKISSTLGVLGLLRPSFPVVQIVGTNGKGSTATMVASLAQERGLTVGVHTSPHFVSFTERVTVNGLPLSNKEWLACANILFEAGADALSYFEFITALSLLAFSRQRVDVAIMETGLGGTWDATTAISLDLVLFTPVDLDHMAVLGTSKAAIAKDKAGAMRPGVPALSALQSRDVWCVFSEEAHKRNVPLFCALQENEVAPDYLATESVHILWPETGKEAIRKLPELGLDGEYQYKNAALALAGWRHLSSVFFAPGKAGDRGRRPNVVTRIAEPVDVRKELAGLAKAWLPGRFQVVPASFAVQIPTPSSFSRPFVSSRPEGISEAGAKARDFFPVVDGQKEVSYPAMILDGAHNAHGLSHLGLVLAQKNVAPLAIIFSCLQDKDVPQLISHVRAFATGAIFIPPIQGNPRAMDPLELASLFGVNAYPTASLEEALYLGAVHMAERMPEIVTQSIPEHPLLVCGSLYLLAEFYALRPDLLIPPSLR